jgi:HD-like signal output (HDOD) protein/CheY-like chemotaxis protein
MLRILFVDDEAHVLDGLRRAMRSMRSVWDSRFAASGVEALVELAREPVDVLVSDMRMPGLDGAQLLNEVKRKYPGTIRFILSGHAEPSAVIQAAATAHQYLAKPCDTHVLKTAIGRAQQLKDLVSNPEIAAWTGAAEALPSLPAAYQRIVACLKRGDSSVADVAGVVEGDLAISTMLLKLANSAFFGTGQHVRTTQRAVSFLGIDNVAALVMAQGLFKPPARPFRGELDLAALWQHSLRTASIARSLAMHQKWAAVRADDAFLAGLLHDLGHLVIATASPRDRDLAEPAVDHAQVGAYLIGLWGFPDDLIEAIAFHHHPTRATARVTALPGVALPGLLHAANLLADADSAALDPKILSGADAEFFATPGMLERWAEWHAIVLPRPGAASRVSS